MGGRIVVPGRRRLLKEGGREAFEELDPTVRSLVDSTLDIKGVSAQLLMNLSLVGFGDCLFQDFFSGYGWFGDSGLEMRISIEFDKPFTIDWETSLCGYISTDKKDAPWPIGTVLDTLNCCLTLPGEVFGLVPGGEEHRKLMSIDTYLTGTLPGPPVGHCCLAGLAYDVVSVEEDGGGVSDLADVQKKIHDTLPNHIRALRSTMTNLLNEYMDNEERKTQRRGNGRTKKTWTGVHNASDVWDAFEVVDDEN